MSEFYLYQGMPPTPYADVEKRADIRTPLEHAITTAKQARRAMPWAADKLNADQWRTILMPHWRAVVTAIEKLTTGGLSTYTKTLSSPDRQRLIGEFRSQQYEPKQYGKIGSDDSATLLHDALIGEDPKQLPFRFTPLVRHGFDQRRITVINKDQLGALLKIADDEIYLRLYHRDTENMRKNPDLVKKLFESWGV